MKIKREVLLLILTGVIITVIAIFSILNWEVIVYLFTQMTSGVAIVKEYILSLGVMGMIAMTLIIIFCFFFPVISSLPIQIASAVSYGFLFGTVHVVLSIVLASQLTFLLTKNARVFYSKKKQAEQLKLEEKIRNSRRSIIEVLFLAYLAPFIPFLIIHMVAASSGLKWWKYTLVTLIGPIPDIVITLWMGLKVTSSSSPVLSYILIMVIITCVVLSLVYKNKLLNIVFTPRKEKRDGKGNEQ